MPKMIYEVPDARPSEQETISMPMGKPSMYIPINEEITEALKVDDTVTVKVKGVVKSMSNTENAYTDGTYELSVEMAEVEVYPENEYAELAEEDDD